MPLHVGKGRDTSTAIADIIDYVKNPQKTDHGKFIYGYECDIRIADAEFLLSKRQYTNLTGRNRGADDVIAYHLRQAFKTRCGHPGGSKSDRTGTGNEADQGQQRLRRMHSY